MQPRNRRKFALSLPVKILTNITFQHANGQKRIKPENTVCYDSVQEAEAAKKAKCSCIK
jgi:hypothetical protein